YQQRDTQPARVTFRCPKHVGALSSLMNLSGTPVCRRMGVSVGSGARPGLWEKSPISARSALRAVASLKQRRNTAETSAADDVADRSQREASAMTGTYGQVLDSTVDIETRAHELLDALSARARSSASAISLWDPI